MNNQQLKDAFNDLSTALIADACVRLGKPLLLVPIGIHPLIMGSRIAGHVLPARHYGSVDIFLEAMDNAQPGDVLIIDNNGRTDEGCIGDLTVLEAQASQLTGILVWGCHRDSAELLQIGFPVFSYGSIPAGPTRIDLREETALLSAKVGSFEVGRENIVFADDDGALFVAEKHVEDVLATARVIWETERKQAEALKAGKTLREQLQFREYLSKRESDPSYTFRKHLRKLGGSIEE